MNAVGKYEKFRLISYEFSDATGRAKFVYGFDDDWRFEEEITFEKPGSSYCGEALNQALFYCFITLGTSYYKLFPTKEFSIEQGSLNDEQASFFSDLYRGGLSQFVYENELNPDDIGRFVRTEEQQPKERCEVRGEGILALQSGGKDSLLAAELLKDKSHSFDAWHVSSSGKYPGVVNEVGAENVLNVHRQIDLVTIKEAIAEGGLNGHVPFSAIIAGLALVDAVIKKRSYVVAANEASSDEGNLVVDGFEINHMYSKTFDFETALQNYIHKNIATDLDYVSLIRPFNDLRVAELFAEKCWDKYGKQFASCNIANYKQGQDDGNLSWCGNCSKCANAFLLFAPFVGYDELTRTFSGQNLFEKESLREYFLALLGIEGIKPFECVGTIDELRQAYHMAGQKDVRFVIHSVDVPQAQHNYQELGDYQPIVGDLIDDQLLVP